MFVMTPIPSYFTYFRYQNFTANASQIILILIQHLPHGCRHLVNTRELLGSKFFFDPQKIVLETSSFWGRVDLVPSCPGTDLTWDRFGFGDEVTVIPLAGTNRSVKDRFRKSGSIAERGSTELAMDCSGLKQINKL